MPRGVVAASVVQQILQSDDVGGDGGDRFRGIGSANPLGIPPDGDDIAPEIRFRILAHQYIDEEGADHAGRAGYRDGLAVQSGPVDGQGRAM